MIRRPPRSTLFPYTRSSDLKIAAVGRDVQAPAGARVIDARGKVVMPGMIDAGDQLGLVEIPAEQRSEEHTSELQSRLHLVCRLSLEKINSYYPQHQLHLRNI